MVARHARLCNSSKFMPWRDDHLDYSTMKTYLITYDLYRPGQQYTGLTDAIKGSGTWAHIQQSVWVIKSNLNAVSIRDILSAYLDQNDKLFVCELGNEAAWFGLPLEISNWLQGKLVA
jgi:hypothetical protein